jgi:hypothetical protein
MNIEVHGVVMTESLFVNSVFYLVKELFVTQQEALTLAVWIGVEV